MSDTIRQVQTDALYEALDELAMRAGGRFTLNTATSREGWPKQGVYFFFESGEVRVNGRPRVTRVGTHALTSTSKTTLWNRLSQHRGNTSGRNAGGGNHRGSVFRQHVGTALIARDELPDDLLRSWLSPRLNAELSPVEDLLERMVSDYIGSMPFVVLDVPTKSDGTSDRGVIERYCISLLSRSTGGVDGASSEWLGRFANSPAISRSGLWNVNHVDETADAGTLNWVLEYAEGKSAGDANALTRDA